VTNNFNNTVFVINTTTNAVVATVGARRARRAVRPADAARLRGNPKFGSLFANHHSDSGHRTSPPIGDFF
jgi:DNA-binding beta-propeller fold protein YncE